MDFIRPIGPVERDIDPIRRIEQAHDDEERREQEQEKRRRQPAPEDPQEGAPEGPTEGDDGHLHIDVRA